MNSSFSQQTVKNNTWIPGTITPAWNFSVYTQATIEMGNQQENKIHECTRVQVPVVVKLKHKTIKITEHTGNHYNSSVLLQLFFCKPGDKTCNQPGTRTRCITFSLLQSDCSTDQDKRAADMPSHIMC